MIGIIDYGAGNILSVKKAIEFLGGECRIVKSASDLYDIDSIILPGVGSFDRAIESMKEKKLYAEIKSWVDSDRPFLGICLGMQLLFESSAEGREKGLSFFKGKCLKLSARKVPLIGWSSIRIEKSSKIFKNIPDNSFFYFLHSYYATPSEDVSLATNDYAGIYCCAVNRGSVFGVQFHPEKSGDLGLKVISNWMEA